MHIEYCMEQNKTQVLFFFFFKIQMLIKYLDECLNGSVNMLNIFYNNIEALFNNTRILRQALR